MKKKTTKVPRHRHPDAEYPVLCKSVADKIHLGKVEKLKKFPVFTEDGKTAYSTERTLLWCAEEYERGRLGGWDNVEFYIVPDLKNTFGYNMVIPLQYYWVPDETGSSGKKRADGKKKAR
jgi:hypothetical protein